MEVYKLLSVPSLSQNQIKRISEKNDGNKLKVCLTNATKHSRARTFWNEEEIKILSRYYSENGRYFVSKFLNRSPRAVAIKAYKFGLRRSHRLYTFNEGYFDMLAPKKAYFLGLLAADGYIMFENGRYQVTLNLRPEDREILEQFKKELDAEQSIRIYRDKRGYVIARLRFYSKHFTESVVRYGIIPRKSLRLLYPQLPEDEEYHRCFIRGYSDGDGCICHTRQLGRRWSLVGNKEFLESLAFHVQKFSGVKGRLCVHKEEHQNYKQLIYSGENAAKALEWLYGGGIKLCLTRKREKWLEWKKYSFRIKSSPSENSSLFVPKLTCISTEALRMNATAS
jgi:hypothetical protein